MKQLIKIYFLVQLLVFNKTIIGIIDHETNYQDNDVFKQKNNPENKNNLEEMKKRHKAEQNNLSKVYDKKEQNLKQEHAKKIADLKTNERVKLSDPTNPIGKSGKTTSQEKVVNDHYDNKLKQLKNERKEKLSALKEAQYQQRDSFTEQQLAINDALNADFKAKSDTEKSNPTEKSNLAKGIETNKKYSNLLSDLKDSYENKISKLESQYKTNWDRLNKKKEQVKSLINITIDKQLMTGDEAEEYYIKQMDELKTKLDADKKQSKDLYTEQKEDLQEKLSAEAKKLFQPRPKKEPFNQATLKKELSTITPRQIERFVNQFSKEIVPDLTPKQKLSLKDLVSSLKEDVDIGMSINDILENRRENIVEKLQLSTEQKNSFNQNYTNINNNNVETSGLFKALLDLLKKILSA